MKSFYYLSVCCAMVTVSSVSAQNLYDIAAPVSLHTSIPLKWTASVKVGYDDNVNAVPRNNPLHQASSFTSIDIGASMSDVDSRTQLSFNGKVGGIFYLDKMRFGSNQVLSNTTFSSVLTHVIDPTLRYSANLNLSYQPEPDYQSGVASPRKMGDYLQAYFNNSISKAWSNRLSTISGFSLSMLDYQEASASTEDNSNFGLNHTFRFKWNTRSASLLEWRGTYTDRKYGDDSLSNFVFGGVEYALDKHTNATLKLGPQFKNVSGRGMRTSLSVEGAVDRMVTNRVACGVFVRLADESTETYSYGESYATNLAARIGIRGSYRFSPIWTLSGNINMISSEFSNGEGIYTPDRKETTMNVSAHLDCHLSRQWSAQLTYSFTDGQYSGGMNRPSYARNVLTLGSTYNF